jgi:hypothetical protein
MYFIGDDRDLYIFNYPIFREKTKVFELNNMSSLFRFYILFPLEQNHVDSM